MYILVYKHPYSPKIVLNSKVTVKQAYSMQYCGRVPLIVIGIDSLTTNNVHCCQIPYILLRTDFSKIFNNGGCLECSLPYDCTGHTDP